MHHCVSNSSILARIYFLQLSPCVLIDSVVSIHAQKPKISTRNRCEWITENNNTAVVFIT